MESYFLFLNVVNESESGRGPHKYHDLLNIGTYFYVVAKLDCTL